jgi:extracellular elastinolytic metalloproteinase
MSKINILEKLRPAKYAAIALMPFWLWPGDALAGFQSETSESGTPVWSFDARLSESGLAETSKSAVVAQRQAHSEAVEALRTTLPGLVVDYDKSTGVTRSLYNPGGYLTVERPQDEAMTVADEFVSENAALLGLNAQDLDEYEVTDEVYSSLTGVTHIYLRQVFLGLPVYNRQLQLNVSRDGRIISVNNAFVPDVAAAVNASLPALGAANAVVAAARHLNIDLQLAPEVLRADPFAEQATAIRASELSRQDVEASLMWLPIGAGEVRLVWNFQVYTLDERHIYDFTVDAGSGQVWTRFDWVANDAYRVFPQPAESPNHTASPPPSDGRVRVIDPADATASPYGWHDTNGAAGAEYTIHRGNNVHAYEDSNNSDSPPAFEPNCGASLDCDFDSAIDFGTQQPNTYLNAAVTNLFYWNNIIHDIQYQYGFDESAGNFQMNNYGGGGASGDPVAAHAQDGSGTDNANFATPPDGQSPTMQMFVFTQTNPRRDGDFDNGIVVHEYGHGISNRLVGGPSNVSCLQNTQQPGEGLSDWWALVYTARPGAAGTDRRGMGTYVVGQATDGDGVRTQPYSTDPAINSHTYESIGGLSVPHGVGEVFAQAYWEVYWALVGAHGFDANLYNAQGGSGNQRAMLYLNEGLKFTACSPTFTDVRDGILQAAGQLFNGEDVCLMWEAFAAFGLGTDAQSGGPDATNVTNGFAVPASCQQGNPPPQGGPPAIDSPAPGSTLTSSTVTFTGGHTNADQQHWLYVGTTSGGSDLFNQDLGTGHSATVSNLPSNGTIHVRYWTRFASGWEYTDQQYTMSVDATPAAATLVSPSGSIGTKTPTYTWNAVSNSTWYYLWVNDSTGNKIKTWYRASEANCGDGTGTCSVAPNTALAEGDGKWWIQTYNGNGYGPWSTAMSFNVNGGAFDVTENQLIDDTNSGSCLGEVVATIVLDAAANSLTVDFSFPRGDLDMSVEEPDGSCAWYGAASTANGGQHSGDVTAGGTESYSITNGPSGTYTVRAHTHTNAETATAHIFGSNGTVDLTPGGSGLGNGVRPQFVFKEQK